MLDLRKAALGHRPESSANGRNCLENVHVRPVWLRLLFNDATDPSL